MRERKQKGRKQTKQITKLKYQNRTPLISLNKKENKYLINSKEEKGAIQCANIEKKKHENNFKKNINLFKSVRRKFENKKNKEKSNVPNSMSYYCFVCDTLALFCFNFIVLFTHQTTSYKKP